VLGNKDRARRRAVAIAGRKATGWILLLMPSTGAGGNIGSEHHHREGRIGRRAEDSRGFLPANAMIALGVVALSMVAARMRAELSTRIFGRTPARAGAIPEFGPPGAIRPKAGCIGRRAGIEPVGRPLVRYSGRAFTE
jgi:hypothetical protein